MINCLLSHKTKLEPRHDKTNKVTVHPVKTQISLGIRPVCSESSLSAWRKLRSLATHWAHSEDPDQSEWMPRLIWVFTGHTVTLLVLSCRGSVLLLYDARFILFIFITEPRVKINSWGKRPVVTQNVSSFLKLENYWACSNIHETLFGIQWPALIKICFDKVSSYDVSSNTIWATSHENVSSGIFDYVTFKPACSAFEAS